MISFLRICSFCPRAWLFRFRTSDQSCSDLRMCVKGGTEPAGSVFPAGGKNEYSPGTLFSSHAPIRKSRDWLLSCLARGRCFVTARWRSWVAQRLKLENNQTRMYREFGFRDCDNQSDVQCTMSPTFIHWWSSLNYVLPVLCFLEVKFSLVHLGEWTVSFQVWVPRSCVCSGGTMDNIVDT